MGFTRELAGTEKGTDTQKVRSGGAPVLDEEYAATVTQGVRQRLGGTREKGMFI